MCFVDTTVVNSCSQKVDEPSVNRMCHLILKVKACMDQFCEGLETLGVGSIVRKNPSVLRLFFVFNEVPIDAGKSYCMP